MAHPPAGVILFSRNIQDPPQLSALMTELRRVLPPEAELMVDQEGGRVARLRPPHWTGHPPAEAIGALFADDPASGLRAAWLTGALIGCDCRSAGFTLAAAPVLDLRVPGAHDVIGDRAFASHPSAVARLGRAMANGLLAAGVLPVGKHAPGHGRALVDSHLSLPVTSGETWRQDARPFALNRDLPWMMTAHLMYQALDPDRPATLSAKIINDVIRLHIGFGGVLVTDDLAMKALAGESITSLTGNAPARHSQADSRALEPQAFPVRRDLLEPAELAAQALEAGCDVALYCSGDYEPTEALLRTCPPLTPAAQLRLAHARVLAAACRQALDPVALQEERAKFLA